LSERVEPSGRAQLVRIVRRGVRGAILAACAFLLALVAVGGVSAESPSPATGTSPAPSATPTDAAAPAESPAGSLTPVDNNTCATCHAAMAGPQQALAAQWTASVHGQNGIGCADCHGGDPTSDQVTVAMSPAKGFKGVPDRTATVAVCGTCHSDVDRMRQYQIPTDQYVKYQTSVHGERLLTDRDTRVAICTDCHGVHDVKKASDPTAKVYPLNIPALCASCHADENLMKPYGIRTDQYAIYQQSFHGQQLLVKGDLRAPNCASCHGSHDAQPPTSATVVNVCGKCHTATQALYEQSRHAELEIGPKCWTCHGTHDVALPDESRFFHPTPPDIACSTCHNPGDQSLKLSADRFTKDSDRRCDTCHHPDSVIYAQAEGIHDTLAHANTAYLNAQAKIAEAASAGMIVTDADVQLTEARTSLIRARAAVHTTKLTEVATLADAATAKADGARKFAESRLAESLFRREAMVVVLALIMVTVLALVLIRRQLDHSFAEKEPDAGP
jgi:nitrate/TMAO reductase-like tetraheme cytochrome c subunit